ncbi:MAG TPA: acyltransferase [Acidobacteriaceae bacterium]|nr:acyltransferase [Acidobacteriaceae bacterium]
MGPRTSAVPASIQRFDTIDVLRGVSILAVIVHHTFLRLLFAGYPMARRVPPPVAHLLFWNGGNGVTVFFAVSGFLITLTSLRRFGSLREMKPSLFYRIRFARIAPLLLLTVAVLSVLALVHAEGFQFGHKNPPLWRAVFSALTFHLNWLEARFGYLPGNWDVLWSLSVEEMFYLFFPLVCLACLPFRRGTALFLAVLFAFVFMGPFARTVWTTNEIWQEKSYLGGMDGIALGCLTALLTHWLARRHGGRWGRTQNRSLLALQLAGAAIIALTAVGPRWFWHLLPGRLDLYGSLLSLATCLVMLGSVLRQQARVRFPPSRLTAPVRWFGRHSYEIYLTHEFVVVWVTLLFVHLHPNTNPKPGGIAPYQPPLPHMFHWFVATLLLTAPLGWLTARFVSDPLNRRLRGARPPS